MNSNAKCYHIVHIAQEMCRFWLRIKNPFNLILLCIVWEKIGRKDVII